MEPHHPESADAGRMRRRLQIVLPATVIFGGLYLLYSSPWVLSPESLLSWLEWHSTRAGDHLSSAPDFSLPRKLLGSTEWSRPSEADVLQTIRSSTITSSIYSALILGSLALSAYTIANCLRPNPATRDQETLYIRALRRQYLDSGICPVCARDLLPALAALVSVTAAQATLVDTLFPHLLIPVHHKYPDTAYGTQFFGEVGTYPNGDEMGHLVDMVILFDMPDDFKRNTYHHCSVAFHLDNVTDNWSVEPPEPADARYSFLVYQLQTLPDINDTWNTARSFGERPAASIHISPGGEVVVESDQLACGGGEWDTASFIMIPTDDRAKVWWYELSDPVNGITYQMFE
ncbi:hypothetical protein P152DRAFT_479305 [Eremomyces bilateralis CBS 781.70]|uniref:Ubiquitin 3 binding protein But2 C-terminal domain-containing protein n=1 Tax=Eremomyces bilateralis CBS 781.70 TaxID=1392243 RepID=A0A6G1GB89_9PEZI|nr:uncharacterized protein P152DRAFT_479305 [Eremomyces bilateralis CBS 781.70]KAF1815367.1 hypothetical protein P152DRAFT_479305 [Eremomyces bilateralis CBS 781.70]